MKLLEKIAGGAVRKMALATAVMAGLAFLLAGTASAHPRVVAVPAYVAPAPFYGPVVVATRYANVAPRLRYWDARFRCWRYR